MAVSTKDLVAQSIAQLPTPYADSAKLKALLEAFGTQAQAVDDALLELLALRSIDTATGAQLDGIGDNLFEQREGQSDDQYRVRLRAKLIVNASSGLTEEIFAIIRLMLGEDTTIKLRLHSRSMNGTLSVVTVDSYTAAELIQAGRMVLKATPLGVRLAFIYTPDPSRVFRLSSDGTLQSSASHGLANAGQTTGGKLAGVIQ